MIDRILIFGMCVTFSTLAYIYRYDPITFKYATLSALWMGFATIWIILIQRARK